MLVAYYHRYLAALFLGFLLLTTLWVGLVQLQMGAPTEESRWSAEMIQLKTQIANRKKDPKLILLGGSNVHFGVSARIIERETQIPAVNMGTHAGLDLPYILYLGRTVARPGDLVVMPLEYELYTTEGKPSEVLMDYVLARDPGYLKQLDLPQRAGFYFALSGTELLKRLKNRIRPPAKIAQRYEARSVDPLYGDEMMNIPANQTLGMKQQATGTPPSKSILDGAAENRFAWSQIADFAAWCRENKVTLVATFPEFLSDPQYSRPSARQFFASLFQKYRRLGIPVVGTPQDFIRNGDSFFDTEYHVMDSVRTQDTLRRIDQLKPFLETMNRPYGGSPSRIVPSRKLL